MTKKSMLSVTKNSINYKKKYFFFATFMTDLSGKTFDLHQTFYFLLDNILFLFMYYFFLNVTYLFSIFLFSMVKHLKRMHFSPMLFFLSLIKQKSKIWIKELMIHVAIYASGFISFVRNNFIFIPVFFIPTFSMYFILFLRKFLEKFLYFPSKYMVKIYYMVTN